MGATYNDKVVHKRATLYTYRQNWTTIVLEEQDDGDCSPHRAASPSKGTATQLPTLPPKDLGGGR